MVSPVDTTVKHFHFEMEGAPVLNGVAGSMLGVLDACLLTGFGLKAATSLAVAGGVATLNFAGTHGATLHSVVLVEGVTGALTALNGEQRVTALGAGQIKFATDAPDGTAAGTVTFKMAPAGWAKPFSGTNLAAYRSPHPQSTGTYLRVDDTGTTSYRLRGYESMIDASTGAGLFPLDAQIPGGGWGNKSVSATASPVKWTLVADSRGVYFSPSGQSASGPQYENGRTIFFGDFQAFRTGGDPFAFVVSCGFNGISDAVGAVDAGNALNQYAPRAHHGLGSSVALCSLPEIGSPGAISGVDTLFGQFPSDVDGGLLLSRRMLMSASTGVAPRGVLPGLYTVPQSRVGLAYAPRTLQAGAGPLAGRSLLAVGCGSSSILTSTENAGISFIDITGPWAR